MELPLRGALSVSVLVVLEFTAKVSGAKTLVGRNQKKSAGRLAPDPQLSQSNYGRWTSGRRARCKEPEALVRRPSRSLLQRSTVGGAPILDVQALPLVSFMRRRRRIIESVGTIEKRCAPCRCRCTAERWRRSRRGAGNFNRCAVGIEDLCTSRSLVAHRERLGTRSIAGVLLHLRAVRR